MRPAATGTRGIGDEANVRYWYSRAGQPESRDTLEAEWHAIVATLIERQYSLE